MRTQLSKYRNVPTFVEGVRFASKKEAKRYQELLLLQRAGTISHLELQPKYDLVVNGKKIGFYRADFRYRDTQTDNIVVEDVKGIKTAVYSLKKKLVQAIYAIDIVEV